MKQPRSKRPKRGVHCGGFLLWSYCPDAVDHNTLEQTIKTHLKAHMTTMKEVTDIQNKQIIRILDVIKLSSTTWRSQLLNLTDAINAKLLIVQEKLQASNTNQQLRRMITDRELEYKSLKLT